MKAHRIRMVKAKLRIPSPAPNRKIEEYIAEFDRLNELKPITYVAKEKSK